MRKAEERIHTEKKERRKLENKYRDIKKTEDAEQRQKENEKRTIIEIKNQLQDMLRHERQKTEQITKVKRNKEQKEVKRREEMRKSEERQRIDKQHEESRQNGGMDKNKENEKQSQQEIERQIEVKRAQEEKKIQEETSRLKEYEKQKQESTRINEKIYHLRQNNHRSQESGKELEGIESRQKNKIKEEAKNEHADYKTNDTTQQFLRSEKNLDLLNRRDKGKTKVLEHSTIIKGSSTKHDNTKSHSNPMQNISDPKKESPASDKVQKDDNSILQEMTDEGDINEAEGDTIRNVLLAIHEKIKRFEKQKRFKQLAQSPNHQLVRRFCSNRHSFTGSEKEFSNCIFEICLAVNFSKKYWPRNTQIISLCLLVKSIQHGILLQINTGEGKTCIIAMFSAFLAVCQIAVDVVSSSPILAQRDFEEWKEFYQLLNISVGCNLTPTDIEERLSCYSNEVVYGTVGSFASDLLRQTFLMENVRGERMCETVIVDEVDCMLLDQGVHSTYLSHAVPGMHHIEPILFMIWKHITKHQKIVTENSKHFFLGVLDSIQVVLSSYVDISKLSNEREIPPEFQWLYLFEREKIFDADFTNKVYNGNDDEFKDSFTIEKILECLKFVETIWQIQFQPYIILNDTTVREVPWKSSSDSPNGQQIHLLVVGEGLVCVIHPYYNEPEIHNFVKSEIENCITFGTSELNKQQIPTYLEDFFANRIISWIENAFIANDMENGREYLVKDDDVVPVDFESTGVVQLDTKWGDCLHQFLEIKHGKKLSQITLITNFMSNQEYFCRYKGIIFGVSGTLGTEREKSFLMRQFSLSCLQIPTHRPNDFKELPGIICSAKDEWISTIQTIVSEQVEKYSNKGQRAVLVICEDINTAKELKTILTQVCASVVLYSRNDEKNDNIEGKLKAGSVIVATNIAGRGTDIDIEESVEKAGGLFVLVTFLPQNTRIENQVFGRSARKGQPGSAQIVLNNQCLPLCFSRHEYTDTASLKNLRDEMEKQRIVNIEEHAFKEVQLKEELFKQYCSFILDIKDHHQFKDVDEKIMLDSLHEHWGMWLKMNCENLANCGQQNKFKQSLAFTLKTAKTKLIERTSPCSNMSHIIKFANEQLLDKNYDLSLELFTRAIVINKEWAAIAYYNRAYCSLLKREKGYIDKAIDDLSKSQDCFRLFKEEAVFCLALSSTIKDEISYEQCVNSDTSEHQENVTTSQFSSRCHIINYFEENIKVALQQLQEFQKAKKDATAEVSSIFTIALGDENTSKKAESEIYLFWEMGLTEVIFVKERNPFCWKGMLVIALGVLQIAVAAVIIASTTVILTQLGWGLITEGVNDICTGAYAVWKRDQEFIKSWMIGKAVSIAISVASFGYSQVCNAAKGAEGVKSTISAIKENCKAGAKKSCI